MDKKKLQIRITEDGEIFAETLGIKGKECLEYIQLLEELLDAETVDSNFTHEYYESEIVTHKQNKQTIKEE
ncbi:DUF2997 domain-containing protein [Halalkalibacterium halodurans]|uniref:DUF2997 domain-containing protein n=1 Tax=Halalkalibacterium halodurans TaxID=86665 RepID=A0A0M0KF87_ALKHA|nr:DUF2997 domain-containing protein [Halalkalibacterium halodurans]MDY7224438.1 DUF2997 domain-containing protein [Halalkalibacterium halodurans]MDY7243723.1 DUF2997 domain-containing protein [Halalkalibacterium halodurans]MED4163252.1 DUF2997 domain-containing protein [Halalkalibacterium halodurans]TES56486.1 DUF2997 domain-containing protein [Halalkalibacterium halodurans]TPE69237.1 DUF2997 domain-containing protein [Halalkalibacterium halodurans]